MDSSSHDNMSFLEHLEELRWHIIRSLIAIVSAWEPQLRGFNFD